MLINSGFALSLAELYSKLVIMKKVRLDTFERKLSIGGLQNRRARTHSKPVGK